MAAPRRLVGVDLGGTNIRAALASGEAGHGPVTHRPTPAADGPDAVLDAVAACVREAAGGAAVEGVAIGIPGPLDPETGLVHAAPHLAGWHEVEAGRLLQARVGCPVSVRNDASLAGFAEWKVGAGQGTRHFLFITASTGVGGALVLNGSVHDGTGSAGEVGHSPADPNGPACRQGHRGCLEGCASGTAIADAARRALGQGRSSSLARLDAAAITAQEVERAARAGDELAIELFAAAGRALGRAVGGLINLLAPEVVAIGGGLINAGELLFEPLHDGIAEVAFPTAQSRCRAVPAALGTESGLVGACLWAVHALA